MQSCNLKLKIIFSLIIGIFITAGIFAVTTEVSAATISKPANNLGLVGYWPFEEGSGTQAGDMSGFGNDGTLTGMDSTDWVRGKVGGALDFDGSNDYIVVANESNFDFDQDDPFSVGFWFKVDTGDTTIQTVFSKQADASPYIGWGIVTNYNGSGQDTGKFGFQLWNNVSGPRITARTTNDTNLYDGNWHHYVFTFNGNGDFSGINFYEDGVSVALSESVNTLAGNTILNNQAVGLGARSDGAPTNSEFYNGLMDEVRIYNRALSASEIEQIYNTGLVKIAKPALADGLVGYWDFNTGKGGTRAYDMSGQGNHGTLTLMDATTDWVDGQIGQGLDFDGSNDYVSLTAENGLTFSDTDSFTYSLWIKTADTSRSILVGDWDNGPSINFEIYDSPTGVLRAYLDTNGETRDYRGDTDITDDEWHHVSFTYDGSDQDIIIYVDGVAESLTIAASNVLSGSFNHLGTANFGRDNRSSSHYYDGQMDEVRIYNRALSSEEIQRLYQLTGPKIAKPVFAGGLVGYWDFNVGKGGTIAYDRSGNGNHGTLTQMDPATDWVDGKVGQGLDFDGSNDNVLINDNNVFDITTNLTLAAWINYASGGENYGAIVDKSHTAHMDPYHMYALQSKDDTALSPRFCLSISSAETCTAITDILSLNQWYHVVAVYNGSTMKIYINGAEKASKNQTGSIDTNDEPINIGSNDNGLEHFAGQIDEVRVYNRALSVDEIKRLYNLGR